MRNVGFNSTIPEIRRVSFRKDGSIILHLKDGRSLSAPLNRFPGIDRLTTDQRRHYHIADGSMILFQDDDEIYHIQDFLGTYDTNSYRQSKEQTRVEVSELLNG